MKSAFSASCVWFYQELARRIGNDKYKTYLKEMNYGNMKTGSAVDSFWLDGDLRISAIEQLEVMKKIYGEKYPFDKRCYSILKNIMVVDTKADYVVRAKTGTVARMTPNTGWYVGYVETADDVWFFAANIDMNGPEQSKLRKDFVYTALVELGIINR